MREDGFADINTTACKEILRRVYDESRVTGLNGMQPSTNRELNICCGCKRYSSQGRQARKDMQYLSPEYVVGKMVSRVRELVAERGWDI